MAGIVCSRVAEVEVQAGAVQAASPPPESRQVYLPSRNPTSMSWCWQAEGIVYSSSCRRWKGAVQRQAGRQAGRECRQAEYHETQCR